MRRRRLCLEKVFQVNRSAVGTIGNKGVLQMAARQMEFGSQQGTRVLLQLASVVQNENEDPALRLECLCGITSFAADQSAYQAQMAILEGLEQRMPFAEVARGLLEFLHG